MSVLLMATLSALCPLEAEALERAAAAFEARYVLQDRAPVIASTIRSDLADWRVVDDCMEASVFAEEATAYLREVSSDNHVMVEPAGGREAQPDLSWIDQWYADAPQTGYGVRRVEILDGNIGYLRLSSFYDLPETWERYAAAFTLLQDTDGLVLDLRRNGGGSPEAELRIQWSFLPADAAQPLVMDRLGEWEDRDVPAIDWPRYLGDRPVAILIDEKTFSAAEATAYGLQSAGRAFVVGMPSAGGAHMVGDPIDLGAEYLIRMPDERPVSPVTGDNWEGGGVQPDLLVGEGDPLKVALEEVRKRRSENRPG